MGYSISVEFKNNDEKERMKSFLISQQNIFKKLQEFESSDCFFHTEPSDGYMLGYAPKKDFLLGFQGSLIPQYIWNVCAWMSVKAQAKIGDENYFYYDDEKILVSQDLNNKNHIIVDHRGIRIVHLENVNLFNKTIDLLFNKTKNIQQQIKIIETLDNQWNDFISNQYIENNSETTTFKRKP